MKKGSIEWQEFELECLAPVHIGNGTTARPYEYLYDAKEQTVSFLNESYLIRFLDRHNLLSSFEEYISKSVTANRNTYRGISLWQWLEYENIGRAEICSLMFNKCSVITNNSLKTRGSLNDIARGVTLPNGQLYIPGSSIKGALRTGILRSLLKKRPDLCKAYWDELNKCSYGDWRNKDWEKELAGVKSIFRGISVSDAAVCQKADGIILQKIDITTKPDKLGNVEKKLPLFRECIPAGTKFRFSITFDWDVLRVAGINSADEVVAAARGFTDDCLQMQASVFGRSCKSEFENASFADLILGGGTGFLSKTLFYTVAPSAEAGRRKLARYLDNVFSKLNKRTNQKTSAHKHIELDAKLSPRTLKITNTGRERSIMGLCALRKMEDENA